MTRSAARLAVVVAALALVAIALPSTASAITSNTITLGATGYGTVHPTGGAPDCVSAASNPQSTQFTCSAFDGSSFDTCTSPDSSGSYSCKVTVQAVAPTGWTFDYWSGDCAGTSTSCALQTVDHSCDPSNQPPCSTTNTGPQTAIAHFKDVRAPTTSFGQAPGQNSAVYSDTRSQQFTFNTDEDSEAPSFACSKDGGAYAGCASGITWSSISDGIHDFCVRATDASGLMGSSTCRHWEQEASPTATITAKPGSITTSPSASFSYVSNKSSHAADGSTLTYTCSLDGAAYGSCPSSYGGLADGSHNFSVRASFHGALEAAGVSHTATASYYWTVDSTAPALAFSDGPADASTFGPGTTQTWTFSASDATTSVTAIACSVDGGPFAACTSAGSESVSALAPGAHTVAVRATDAAGNEQTVTRSLSIDAQPPAVTITSGPGDGATSSGTSATWTWTADEHATFQCRLYSSALTPPAFADCSGANAHTANGFQPGTYTFELIATDDYGNTSQPLKRSFTVTSGSTTNGPGGAGSGMPGSGGPGAIKAIVAAKWTIARRTAAVRKLQLSSLPVGATVVINCKGKGCSFKSRTLTAARATLDLKRQFRKPLAYGASITLTITKRGMTGERISYAVQKRGLPKLKVAAL